jgi:translation initiation factor IF-2
MRVYEYSKESGIPAKELLEILKKEGFEVKSHMSVLSEKELSFLERRKDRSKQAAPQTIEKKAEKIEKAPAIKEAIPQKETTIKMQVSPKKEMPEVSAHPQPVLPKKFEKPVAKPLNQVKDDVVEPGIQSVAEIVLEPMLLTDAAIKLDKSVNEVILTLLKWGIVANKNQMLAVDVVGRLAEHYQIKGVKPATKKADAVSKGQISVLNGSYQERMPVVVVLGHVDHGKTTLLDYIRRTRVAAKEKGGITQHLGAYEASTPQGNIVFLDTPGHEAFSKIRMRGTKVADVVILVVAADDGVMPQTIESIKIAKSLEVPVIVAINKIDKIDGTRLETIKRQLAQYDLLPEEWGGQVVVVPISAKEGTNIDQLLEMILLQSQLLELKADVAGAAKGYVLEAKLEKGRGPVATLITQHGIVKVGDYFIAGRSTGRISSLVSSAGQRLKEANPSVPVQVAGFDELPEAGDYFEVVTKEQQRKGVAPVERKNLMQSRSVFAKENTINLLVKTDTNSSKEALLEAIEKLSKKTPKSFTIVYAGVGEISESDVMLAENTGSTIISLHVKADQNSALLAQHEDVDIETYDIIYKLLEALELKAEAAKEIKMVRKKIGEAVVLKVFDIKNLGVIAGAQVKDGRFSKDGTVIVYRGRQKIGEGKIKSLQRDKKTVKEVHTGFECAFLIDGIDDFQVDDRVECYLEVAEGK